jgi:hypothetical protein
MQAFMRLMGVEPGEIVMDCNVCGLGEIEDWEHFEPVVLLD